MNPIQKDKQDPFSFRSRSHGRALDKFGRTNRLHGTVQYVPSIHTELTNEVEF